MSLHCSLDKEQCFQHCPNKKDPANCPYVLEGKTIGNVNRFKDILEPVEMPLSSAPVFNICEQGPMERFLNGISESDRKAERGLELRDLCKAEGFDSFIHFEEVLKLQLGVKLFRSYKRITEKYL